MLDVRSLYDWMVDGAPGAPTPVHLVARLCPDLLQAGVPLDRVEAFVRTLHPHIAGRSFVWTPGQSVVVSEKSYVYLNSAEFLHSPVSEVVRTGQPLRFRANQPSEAAQLGEVVGPGFTDCLAGPLTFLSGQVHPMTFATRKPGGFNQEHLDTILHVLKPLSRLAEIFALSRTAANLLNTYVGHNAGERILSGKILRGDSETLRAVIWFSDLRGFTTLSSSLAAGEILSVLNDLFDCQVTAIERRGGEVLKFMGDGLLAILPLETEERTASATCDLALDTAAEAFEALGRLNQRRAAAKAVEIQFGLGLHAGELAYGNIGGSGRLDFTCIGPAVNLASRIEGLTSKLGRSVVVSSEFARLTTHPMSSLGRFALKGVPGEQEVFGPT